MDDEKSVLEYIHKDNPSLYLNIEGIVKSRDLLRDFREYGVPSDVAQTYIPRGMKVADLFGTSRDNDTNNEDDDPDSAFDPWTIVWYIGSFGGLIAFFLVVSCSEWCCLKSRSDRVNARNGHITSIQTNNTRNRQTQNNCTHITDTPPPSYHLFAPPSYDSLEYIEKTEKFDIYVVPVHRISANFAERNITDDLRCNINRLEVGRNDGEPPLYSTITMPPT